MLVRVVDLVQSAGRCVGRTGGRLFRAAAPVEQFFVRAVSGFWGALGFDTPSPASPPLPTAPDAPKPPFQPKISDDIIIGRVAHNAAPALYHASSKLKPGEIVTLPPEDRTRHTYVLGATGVGKTNLLLRLIESDIARNRTFCVIDLRGDLVDRILLRLARFASPGTWRERLLLIDLRQTEYVVGFNPMLGGDDHYGRALHMLSVLKMQAESWGVQVEETTRNSLIALAQSGGSLLEIEPLLTNAAFRQEVLRTVTDRQVLKFFHRYDGYSASVKATHSGFVLNKVTPLLSVPQLRLMYGSRQSFSLRTLLDEQPGQIILVSLAVDRLHESAHLAAGLFLSAFHGAIMARVDQPESARIPVNLYIDEFERMASDRFQEIVAEGRRFRLGLCLSHQNLNQLSTDLRHVVLNNVHTHCYFQTGPLDAAELAREILSQGRGKDEVRHALVSQKVGRAVVVRRGQDNYPVDITHSRDPSVPTNKVLEVKQASFSRYARLSSEVEQEVSAREQYIDSLDNNSPTTQQATYVIRHAKTKNFKPNTD